MAYHSNIAFGAKLTLVQLTSANETKKNRIFAPRLRSSMDRI